MKLINWSGIKDTRSLIEFLFFFLKEIFGAELEEEARKLYDWNRITPESYEYLRPLNVHRATKWYVLLQKLRKNGYSFDLRFSAEIEEFQRLLLFAYSLNTLTQSNIISLSDSRVSGALLDPNRFESLMYEFLIAANYASNGFTVQLLDLCGTERIDIHARKGNVEVYAECKRLRRSEKYVDIAIEVMRRTHEYKFSGIIDVTLKRTPRDFQDVKKVVQLIENAIRENGDSKSNEYALVNIGRLPNLLANVYEIHVPQPETIEYMVSSSYVGVFDRTLKIKEPKILVLRDPNRVEKLRRQILNELRRASKQLETAKASSTRRVIYVDISEVAGRSMLQLPELIRVAVGPEILASRLESVCREWLLRHPCIDTVVLTQLKLCLDPLGLPYVLTLENRPVLPYVAPGWSIETLIVPIPRNVSPEALVNLGVEMVKRGNYRLAELYYRMAINLKPDLKEAWNNLGRLYTEFLGRPDIGLKYLEKALELDPDYVSALMNKGIALAKLGRYNEALRELNRAIELEPKNHRAWYNKALVHFILEQYTEAYNSSSKALELNSNYTLARNLVEKLKEVLKQRRR